MQKRFRVCGGLSSLLNVAWVHPDDFPDMTIQIIEATAIHKPVIHRLPSFRRARPQCRVDDAVDLILAVHGQAREDFRRLGRVGDLYSL